MHVLKNSFIAHRLFPHNLEITFILWRLCLAGIKDELKYIKELGFDSIWLSPIYEDGERDMGNDVKDHGNVDPKFGTNEDLHDLLLAIDAEGFYFLLV